MIPLSLPLTGSMVSGTLLTLCILCIFYILYREGNLILSWLSGYRADIRIPAPCTDGGARKKLDALRTLGERQLLKPVVRQHITGKLLAADMGGAWSFSGRSVELWTSSYRPSAVSRWESSP